MLHEESSLRAGMTGELSVEVTPEMTAAQFGNVGVAVLATPYLVGLLEAASVRAIQEALLPGQSTVGTHVDISHQAPTPVGLILTASSRLVRVDGRRLTFTVEARDSEEQVAVGTHERYIVDLRRFMEKAAKKRPVQK